MMTRGPIKMIIFSCKRSHDLMRGICIAFNKPYNVLSQFQTNASQKPTLSRFGFPAGVYPVGRLDSDSEGLLLLSDEPDLIDRVLSPKFAHTKTYWLQVEGTPSNEALKRLETGIKMKDYLALPAFGQVLVPQPQISPRDPPIRYRKTVPDTWIKVVMSEGKNRQVRAMTAAVGFPTLRLIRHQIGMLTLDGLEVGKWRELEEKERKLLFTRDSIDSITALKI
jgi:23S rRNA pseudouridine2457 synthase